jgi:ubiquinone biosynthesis protein UbiJ
MATYPTAELLQRWKQQTLTQEQAIGQLLQHIDELKQRLAELDQRLRQLEQQRPPSKI